MARFSSLEAKRYGALYVTFNKRKLHFE